MGTHGQEVGAVGVVHGGALDAQQRLVVLPEGGQVEVVGPGEGPLGVGVARVVALDQQVLGVYEEVVPSVAVPLSRRSWYGLIRGWPARAGNSSVLL